MSFLLKNKINLFIVEDDKMFALALKADIENEFKNMDLKIHLFSSGEISMEKFMQVMPQVVILDYHLDGKYSDAADGIKVLRWMKKENESAKVIMLTGDNVAETVINSFRNGASDYVVKTASKFKEINNSLSAIFRSMEKKNKKEKYRYVVFLLFFCLSLFIGGILSILIFAPSSVK